MANKESGSAGDVEAFRQGLLAAFDQRSQAVEKRVTQKVDFVRGIPEAKVDLTAEAVELSTIAGLRSLVLSHESEDAKPNAGESLLPEISNIIDFPQDRRVADFSDGQTREVVWYLNPLEMP